MVSLNNCFLLCSIVLGICNHNFTIIVTLDIAPILVNLVFNRLRGVRHKGLAFGSCR